ncbi:hypothetical protein B0T20DRAFT_505706 [Sordaria brevicollis]|uniref:Uncharacterized protein n=1 Tax=Sordaria brevicollis TaxID=83679 RepID=A0AAE0UDV0_SORBR|nr:hypothetical protein B0T20DRAFT_505706 [Sordaria brevicollis]
MCTQTTSQSLCSHCKELLLEITTEERCQKVIQAQAYTFSCGTKKTTRTKTLYPRKCAACVKKESQMTEKEKEMLEKNGLEKPKVERSASAMLLSPLAVVAGRGIRCHSCPSLWQLGRGR